MILYDNAPLRVSSAMCLIGSRQVTTKTFHFFGVSRHQSWQRNHHYSLHSSPHKDQKLSLMQVGKQGIQQFSTLFQSSARQGEFDGQWAWTMLLLLLLLLVKFKIFNHLRRLHPNHYLLLGLKEIVIQVGCTLQHSERWLNTLQLWMYSDNWMYSHIYRAIFIHIILQRLMCVVKQGNVQGEKLIEALTLR